MKDITTYIKESVFDPVKDFADVLSGEDLRYIFKRILMPYNKNLTVEDILITRIKEGREKPEELAKKMKSLIEVDKIMVDNNIKQWQKSKIVKDGNVLELYFDTSRGVNPKGYVVVYNPFISINMFEWSFLVTTAASRVGKTLRPVEWIEPKSAEESNHEYDKWSDVPRTFIDDPVEAWKYIENKYGRF